MSVNSNNDLGLCAVTGGHGWFGYFLVATLTQQGYHVRVLDIVDPPEIDEKVNPYCKVNKELTSWIKCDITKIDDVNKGLKNVTTVFHNATVTDIRKCAGPNVYNVNVEGTQNIIASCRQNKCKYLIYTSSVEVNNDGKPKRLINEDSPLVYNWTLYGQTKALSEQLCYKTHKNITNNIKICILRLSHIFGPGDPLIDTTIKIPIEIGPANTLHSFIYVENAAQCHVTAAKALASESYNTINGQAFFIKDFDANFVKFYREQLHENAKKILIRIPYIIAYILAYIYDVLILLLYKIFNIQIGHPVECFGLLAVQATCQEFTYNNNKSKQLLNYVSYVNINEAIKRTKHWYRLTKNQLT